MSEKLKNIAIALLVFAVLGLLIKVLFFPKSVTVEKYEYVKGIETVINRTKEPVLDVKINWNEKIEFQSDTVFIDTAGRYTASSAFDIGNDTLGVNGKVKYIEPSFMFSSLAFRYPRETITKLRIDTVKVTLADRKRFGWGLHLSAGYEPVKKTYGIIIGLGIHWDLTAND